MGAGEEGVVFFCAVVTDKVRVLQYTSPNHTHAKNPSYTLKKDIQSRRGISVFLEGVQWELKEDERKNNTGWDYQIHDSMYEMVKELKKQIKNWQALLQSHLQLTN